ncbi:MAG: hypothetical protein H6748_10695 [Spirochaetaceae bacterium]|nr:hypothetical protein [Myxococcales bacterium]MCB9724501.1 hypothetical protein [Spirochaetaceae bacterium]HPG26200.1 hypothetical protein [Myxococcota bacterium]
MLSGFNTNFRHRGVLFHVQTEDSGRGNPHVITHLFHGGNIMASEKRDYSDLLEQGDLEASVRKLMESQHKAMLKRLSRGEHDATIEQRLGPDVFRADVSGQTDSASTTEEERPPMPPGREAEVAAASVAATGRAPTAAPAPGSLAEPTRLEPADEPSARSRLARVFGDRVVSEKPLDEVVLDYLVENARKRKRTTK